MFSLLLGRIHHSPEITSIKRQKSDISKDIQNCLSTNSIFRMAIHNGKYVTTLKNLIIGFQDISLHGKQMGKQWKQCQTLFLRVPK